MHTHTHSSFLIQIRIWVLGIVFYSLASFDQQRNYHITQEKKLTQLSAAAHPHHGERLSNVLDIKSSDCFLL